MMNYPPHFTRRELACKCGCGLCNPRDELLHLAEAVRHVLGDTPMIVNSCCRCEKHNRAVGGSPTSKHLTGRALDFRPLAMSVFAAYAKIITAYERGELPELGGIGLYVKKNFIHIDTYHAPDG